jgi:hypothetical protein
MGRAGMKMRMRRGSYRTPLEGERRGEERDSSGGVLFLEFSPFPILFYTIFLAVKCRNTGYFYFFFLCWSVGQVEASKFLDSYVFSFWIMLSIFGLFLVFLYKVLEKKYRIQDCILFFRFLCSLYRHYFNTHRYASKR